MAEKGTPEQEPAEEATLAQDLEATFDTLEAEEQEQPEAPAEEEPGSTEADTSEEDEAAPDETQASGEEAEEAEEPEASEDDEDESPIEPPQHWAEEHKEKFRDLPRSGQDFLLERHKQMEADYTRKSQEIADVKKAIEPVRQQLKLNGMSEGQYIGALTAADQYLNQSPKEGIQWLAQRYGVDLNEIGQGSSEEEDFDKDPYVQQLERKVQDLEQRFQGREQSEQQASQQQLDQQVQQFADEKDDKGDYKHPHFDQVRTHMGALLNAGAAETLEDAYDQAVWARPDLRTERLEAEKREAAQREKQRRKEKASKAKKAATPSSSGPTKETPEQPADLRTDLSRQWDQLST